MSTVENVSPIAVSPRASAHIQRFLQKRGQGLGLRIGVRTSGCSGLSYTLEFVDEALADDVEVETGGVKIYIAPQSLPFLRGIELDFVREGLNEGFKFNNPNVKGECGCGESFTV